MNIIDIETATHEYSVYVAPNATKMLGHKVAELKKPGKAVIISDSNVWPLHGASVEDNLKESGFETMHYCFPAGESSKNAETYLNILNFLAENQFTRSDVLIALGGGVVGDMTGFVAATYLRGVTYVQVPTTLLAMVDSSVGGKTAIDLAAGKNLAGAFYQPSLVICDTKILNTLPEEIFRDGCAEVIKYAVLFDADLFDHLLEAGLNFNRMGVIATCIDWKRKVVEADEFDKGERQKLNLGHTFGHAIEKESDFSITHGQAVAIGMTMSARFARKNGTCSNDTVNKIQTILDVFGLPSTTDFSAKQLADAALSDKKRSGNKINLIIPKEIGDCMIYPTDISKLQSIFEEGL